MFALSIKKGHEDGGALVMFVNAVVAQIKTLTSHGSFGTACRVQFGLSKKSTQMTECCSYLLVLWPKSKLSTQAGHLEIVVVFSASQYLERKKKTETKQRCSSSSWGS